MLPLPALRRPNPKWQDDMADGGPSNSPAFVPPQNHISDTDPMIVSVGMKKETDIGFRMSQQSGLMKNNPFTISHVKNGG